MINYNIWNNKKFSNAVISKQSIKWLNQSGQSIFTVGPNLYKVEIIKGVTFYTVTPGSPGDESIINALIDNKLKKEGYDNPTASNSITEYYCFFEINLKEIDLISFKFKTSNSTGNVMAIHSIEDVSGQIAINLPNSKNGIELKDLIKQNAKTDLVRIRFYYGQDQTNSFSRNFYIEVQKKWSKKIEAMTFYVLNEFKKNNLVTME